MGGLYCIFLFLYCWTASLSPFLPVDSAAVDILTGKLVHVCEYPLCQWVCLRPSWTSGMNSDVWHLLHQESGREVAEEESALQEFMW